MEFRYKGQDVSSWVGKEIVWSGQTEGYFFVTSWKDVFGKVISFDERGITLLTYDENKNVTFSEAGFNKVVSKFELLTPEIRQEVVQEGVMRAKKNFSNEVAELIGRYKLISKEDKRKIIELYL
jgi:hypothetical protein